MLEILWPSPQIVQLPPWFQMNSPLRRALGFRFTCKDTQAS